MIIIARAILIFCFLGVSTPSLSLGKVGISQILNKYNFTYPEYNSRPGFLSYGTGSESGGRWYFEESIFYPQISAPQ